MLAKAFRKAGGALAIGCASVLIVPWHACAQTPPSSREPAGAFVTLEFKGPLDDQTKAILGRLLEPRSTPKLIETVAKQGALVAEICGPLEALNRCSNLGPALVAANRDAISSAVASDVDARKIEDTQASISSSFPTNGSGSLVRPKEYVIFGAQDPIVRLAGRATPSQQPILVPRTALDTAGIAFSGPHVSGQEAVARVEDDLRLSRISERNFRINRRLPEDQVSELIAALNAAGGDVVSATRAPLPKSSFSLIQFQNTGASCTAKNPNWPFDADRVRATMVFNADILQRMKLGRPRRSRILIVDTGLGKALAQTEVFNRLLYPDVTELIVPASLQRDFNQARCTDANENGYWRDVYGTGSGAPASDDTRCLSAATTALDLIDPHPKVPTSQQLYNPDHGSFVAGLAAGGPRLIAQFPQISDYIGLTFFRVPQRSEIPQLSIINEFSDISKSLDYAGKIEADVINMSLKTDRDEPFRSFLGNTVALLVAAAGNGKEDLDNRPSENFPASMNMSDRMIVVAALQPNPDAPFWGDSAFSPSRVHIAAPGATISSFDARGEEICDSGTSAAAPLVSFVAATIKALTGAPRSTLRARILAAADRIAALDDKVEDGRRLNVEAALDLFVDRIEFKDGSPRLLRGWIEPDRADPLVRVCKDASGSLDHLRGQIDLALLWEWYRRPDEKIALKYNRSATEVFTPGACDAPAGTFRFYDYQAKTKIEIDWSQVQRVLPTPFRSVKNFIVN